MTRAGQNQYVDCDLTYKRRMTLFNVLARGFCGIGAIASRIINVLSIGILKCGLVARILSCYRHISKIALVSS